MDATAPPHDTEAYRWRRPDGSRLVLTTRGRLLEAAAARGAYATVLERCTPAEARSRAEAGGYRRVGADGSGHYRARRTGLSGIGWGPDAGKCVLTGDATRADLTPEQQAVIDARIEAHAARVAEDLARLGFSPTGGLLVTAQNGTPAPPRGGNAVIAARQQLHALLRTLGPDAVYEVARNHATDQGLPLTREDYQSLHRSLWPERHQSAKGPRADLPDDEAAPAPPPANGRAVSKRDRSQQIRAFVEGLGARLGYGEAKAKAAAQGLALSPAAYDRHRRAVYGDPPAGTRGAAVKAGMAAARAAKAGVASPPKPAEPAPPPPVAPPTPAPVAVASVSLLLDLAAVVRRCGGVATARGLLAQLEEIGAALGGPTP